MRELVLGEYTMRKNCVVCYDEKLPIPSTEGEFSFYLGAAFKLKLSRYQDTHVLLNKILFLKKVFAEKKNPLLTLVRMLLHIIYAYFRSLDPRFLSWLNSLFYLPPEGELRVRKEYRMLSDTERNNFHTAIRLLKQDTVSISLFFSQMDYPALLQAELTRR